MTETNELKFKPGDKVVKNNDLTIYTIVSVYFVKPVYYVAMGELGNQEIIPETKLTLLSEKYHDELISDNKETDSRIDKVANLFSEKKVEKDSNLELSELKYYREKLTDVINKKKELLSEEEKLRNKITALEMENITKELNISGRAG